MAITDGTYPFASRATGGTLRKKNIYSNTFGYTETNKKVSNASNTAVLSATSLSGAGATTIVDNITQPDVPRALSVTLGGTAGDIAAGTVVVHGTNVEGKPITDTFITTVDTANTITGNKAFKSITRVVVSKQDGNGATVAVGTRNVLGLNHRLFRNNTTVKVYSATAVSISGYTGFALQAAPTVTANERDIELNTVVPATAPNGSTFLVIAYAFDNWALAPVNDQPEYSTTTSTSTSTTITTTTSTSTSASSSSTSTSASSTSTSSTSTSTTTAP